jgi:hypothetical protein
MGIIARIIDKPTLYHYTNPDSLLKILSSRALLARPICEFPKDASEYVLGLGLIEKELERIYCARNDPRPLLVPGLVALLNEYGIDARRFLEQTIAHIEYELKHSSTPKVQLYVACVSATVPTRSEEAGRRMLAEYGHSVITFNWMLPLTAYSWPRPFTFSMLSRVSYDEQEFVAAIIHNMGFDGALNEGDPDFEQSMARLNLAERTAAMALTVAIMLCSFAANIKKPEFKYENEWRLKTARSFHGGTTLFRMADWGGVRKHVFKMNDDATFIRLDPARPDRYVQELSCEGKMILQPPITTLLAPPVDAAKLMACNEEMMRFPWKYGPLFGAGLEFREALLRADRQASTKVA